MYKIGVIAPSSPISLELRDKSRKEFLAKGYEVIESQNISDKKGFWVKSPKQNVKDLEDFFIDDSISFIWCARGGYGSNYMLPYIDKLKLEKKKIVAGSSDASYFLWYLLDRFKSPVFYSPMIYSTIHNKGVDLDKNLRVLKGEEKAELRGKTLIKGSVKGELHGGCLTILNSLTGSQYFPNLKNKLLILEDINEPVYKLDRMFWQLSNIGVFENIKGLILNCFPNSFRDEDDKNYFLSRVLYYCQKYNFPVIYDLPLGHGENLESVELGRTFLIDAQEKEGFLLQV